MGACISKCIPKTSSKVEEECNIVQDKLVISQAPIQPSDSKTFCPPSPSPSPSPSTSSFSSLSCTTSISSCSSTASSNSVLSSKLDRSFSNEFLWSCVKENPHIVRNIDSIKENSPTKSVPTKSAVLTSAPVPARQSTPQRVAAGSTQQKRVLRSPSPSANSPTHTRQRIIRKEPAERNNSSYSLQNRALRSPSPSGRFHRNVMNTDAPKECCNKLPVGSRTNSGWKENIRPASPNNNSSRQLSSCLKNKDACTHKISPKLDEKIPIGEVLCNQHIDSLPMEDIDNPFISLDCFIFL